MQQDPMSIAEELRKNTIKVEGTRSNFPEEIISLAAERGYTWEDTLAGYEVASVVYEAFRAKGATPDLTHNPLVQQMAEILVMINKPAQEQAAPQPPDVATMANDFAASAGM